MIVTIDYDNNCIRLKQRDSSSKDDVIIPIKKDLKDFEKVLTELINMMCDGEEHVKLSLLKQDDGTITAIEEY